MPVLLSASGRVDSLGTVTRAMGRGLCTGGVTTATGGVVTRGFLTGGFARTVAGWRGGGFVVAVAGWLRAGAFVRGFAEEEIFAAALPGAPGCPEGLLTATRSRSRAESAISFSRSTTKGSG